MKGRPADRSRTDGNEMDIALIILGLLFIIASMAFVLNPPEAWVKKAFRRSRSSAVEHSAETARSSSEKLK